MPSCVTPKPLLSSTVRATVCHQRGSLSHRSHHWCFYWIMVDRRGHDVLEITKLYHQLPMAVALLWIQSWEKWRWGNPSDDVCHLQPPPAPIYTVVSRDSLQKQGMSPEGRAWSPEIVPAVVLNRDPSVLAKSCILYYLWYKLHVYHKPSTCSYMCIVESCANLDLELLVHHLNWWRMKILLEHISFNTIINTKTPFLSVVSGDISALEQFMICLRTWLRWGSIP